jgi:hypothetical protein
VLAARVAYTGGGVVALWWWWYNGSPAGLVLGIGLEEEALCPD